MRRSMLTALILIMLTPNSLWAEEEFASYSWADKLGRGVVNFFLSPLEVPRSITNVTKRRGGAMGWTVGLVSGAGRMFFRAGAGVLEAFTFPFDFPNDQKMPIVYPVYPWQNWE